MVSPLADQAYACELSLGAPPHGRLSAAARSMHDCRCAGRSFLPLPAASHPWRHLSRACRAGASAGLLGNDETTFAQTCTKESPDRCKRSRGRGRKRSCVRRCDGHDCRLGCCSQRMRDAEREASTFSRQAAQGGNDLMSGAIHGSKRLPNGIQDRGFRRAVRFDACLRHTR